MFKKYLYLSLLCILIFIIHQSFLLTLWPSINLWPVLCVFCIFFFKPQTSLYIIILSGFLLDIYFSSFGLNLLFLFIISAITYFLQKNLLTNRSLISFSILNLLAVLLLNLFFFIAQISGAQIIHLGLKTIFFQLITNLVLSFILFYIVSRFTNLLRSRLFEN